MVDALASGASGSNPVEVQVLSRVPIKISPSGLFLIGIERIRTSTKFALANLAPEGRAVISQLAESERKHRRYFLERENGGVRRLAD